MLYNPAMINAEDLTNKFYTPKEVAEMLRVNYFSIYFKIKRGEIEGHQVGRKWLVTPSAITKYLNRKETPNETNI